MIVVILHILLTMQSSQLLKGMGQVELNFEMINGEEYCVGKYHIFCIGMNEYIYIYIYIYVCVCVCVCVFFDAHI